MDMMRTSLPMSLAFRRRVGLGSMGRGQYYSAQPPSPRLPALRRKVISGLSTIMIGGSAVLFLSTPAHLDRPSDDSPNRSGATESLATLLRSYLVYSACSVPALIDSAPGIISTAQSIPIIRTIAEAIIRQTFFDQVSLQFSLTHWAAR